MKKFYPIILAIMAYSLSSFGQKAGLNSINKNDLKAYMTFFASDGMQGRETGTPANDLAALYIKTNIMRLGLKPIPETGDYIQRVPFVSKKVMHTESYLKISRSNGEQIYSTDSILFFGQSSETLELKGSAVFAGYGWEDTITGYNDLKGLDLKDKIVFIMTRNPELVNKDEGKTPIQMDVEEPKISRVLSKGPKAVFFIYDPRNNFHDAYNSGISHMIPSETISLKGDQNSESGPQVGFLTQHAVDMMLGTTGNSLKQLQDRISNTNNPASFELENITVTVKTAIENKEFTGQNVIGLIEGSDPLLKKECIVYSAHFDHVAKDDKGEVCNGADDDASGSMALIEIAQAYMNLKTKPLRTIVFTWFTGEEKGLLGSNYYVKNPAIPIKNTLIDINLDMIGRSKNPSDTGKFFGFDLSITNPGEVLAYSAHESAQFDKMLIKSAEQTGVTVIDKGKDLEFGGSDHQSFQAEGVQNILFISGIHSDLHSSRDDVDKIDFDKMESVSKMVFLLGYKVSNQRERIKIDKKK